MQREVPIQNTWVKYQYRAKRNLKQKIHTIKIEKIIQHP